MSGEFAGYALDEAIDPENDRWLYRQGVMSDAQAFELGIIDHMGRYNHVPMFPVGARAKASVKTCRHCGTGGLSWISTGKGWRLALDGVLHVCAQYKR